MNLNKFTDGQLNSAVSLNENFQRLDDGKEDKQKNVDWTPVTLLNGYTGSVNIPQKNGIVQFT